MSSHNELPHFGPLGNELRQDHRILEHITDAFLILDQEWRCIYLNQTAERFWGLERETVLGKNIWEVFPQAVGSHSYQALHRALAEQAPVVFETISPVMGQWIMVRVYPSPEGLIIYFQDISERKHAEVRQRLLVEVSEMVAGSLHSEITLDQVAALAVNALADWCSIYLYHDDGTVRLAALSHANPADAPLRQAFERHRPHVSSPVSTIATAYRQGQALLLPEITYTFLQGVINDPEHLALIQALAPLSAMVVPLCSRGEVLGVITFISTQSERRYTQEDLNLAEELTRRAATALDNARLYEAQQRALHQAERAANQTRRLLEVAADLSSALTSREVADVILQQGVEALGAQAGSVACVTEDGTMLESMGAIGYPPEAIVRYRHIPIETVFPLTDVIRTGKPLFLRTPEERDAHYPHLAQLRQANGSGAMAALPLILDERVIGSLGFNFPENQPFRPEDELFLVALAHHCGQALERARLYEAEQQAHRRAEQARARLAFLADASTRLFASLHEQDTSEEIVALLLAGEAREGVLPIVWAALDLVEADGRVRRVAMGHATAAWEQALAQGQADHFPLDPQAPSGAATVIHTGQRVVIQGNLPTYSEPTATAGTEAEGQTGQPLAYLSIPLMARDHVLGALSFVLAVSEAEAQSTDLELAEEFARRAAQAIDNARLYQQAQAAIQLRDEFLSIASHELKTPVTALQGYAQLLRRRAEREGSDRDTRAFATMNEQAQRLVKLIDLLLDLSRLQGDQLALESAPVDLTALCQRVGDSYHPLLDTHSMTLELPPHPLAVTGDELRLEQVIQNLLDNAIKYSPQGGSIAIRLSQEGALATLSIQDQGIGIPPEAQARLFDRFYRAAHHDNQGITGLGIGLYLVREIVMRHGGSVTVESHPGHGSLFRVVLPVAELEASRNALAPSSSEEG